MKAVSDRPLDALTFKACQEALEAALATAQQWSRERDPQLKAKLALLIMRDASAGQADPVVLRKRALERYFLQGTAPL